MHAVAGGGSGILPGTNRRVPDEFPPSTDNIDNLLVSLSVVYLDFGRHVDRVPRSTSFNVTLTRRDTDLPVGRRRAYARR